MSESDATRWEYETLRPPRDETKKEAEDPKAALSQLGAEGWELVETIDYVGGRYQVPRFQATCPIE